MTEKIINVSADAAPPLRTRRHGYRDTSSGRYSPLPHREPVIFRDSVTGEARPGPSNAVVARENDGLAEERLHRIAPDYSSGPSISAAFDPGTYSSEVTGARGLPSDPARLSNEGLIPAQNLTNHVLSCPRCATGLHFSKG